jgi:hypothetical protein
MLKKAASGSATPQTLNSSSPSTSSSKHLHAVLQARVMHLQKELMHERQRHQTTAACLAQEQEMLAVLATRLAAVETNAGHATCDASHLQQLLQEEQQLHDITLNALETQLKVTQQLQQKLHNLALAASTTPAAASGLGRATKHVAFRALCVLTGVAAAAALPAKSLPPAVLSLAAPAATATIAAQATTAALRAVGWLMRLLAGHKRQQQQKQQQQQRQETGASIPFNSAAVSAWAAGPLSFDCWGFGDAADGVAFPQDLCSHCCCVSDEGSSSRSSSRSSTSSNNNSSSSSSRKHYAVGVEQYVILPWDDVQSEMSYDLDADSTVFVSEPLVMVDAACQCNKAGHLNSSACMLAMSTMLAQQQQQQQQQQQEGSRAVRAGVLYLAPHQGRCSM